MANVCFVTGGGSGIGLETARKVGKGRKVVLVGRTVSKLEDAIKSLKESGVDAESFPIDISDRDSVAKAVAHAASLGKIEVVINAAGLAPGQMSDYMKLFCTNAMGTVYVDSECAKVMDGGVIINVASSSAYMLPEAMLPTAVYPIALDDPDAFLKAIEGVFEKIPEERRLGLSYPISKNFVKEYSAMLAIKLMSKNIRVASISPGSVKTTLAQASPTAEQMAVACPLGRWIDPSETAAVIEMMVNDPVFNATDVLHDGGAIAQFKANQAQQAKQG